MTPVLTDPDLGFTRFTVQRTTYLRQNGTSVPAVQILPASGLHPSRYVGNGAAPAGGGTAEEFIAIYIDFALSLGENNGGEEYSVPDRILWNVESWRVVRVCDWPMFGYCQGLTVKIHQS